MMQFSIKTDINISIKDIADELITIEGEKFIEDYGNLDVKYKIDGNLLAIEGNDIQVLRFAAAIIEELKRQRV